MKVSVLSYADCDMSGVIGVFTSPGEVIEYFFRTYDLSVEETKKIEKEVAESFRMRNNQQAFFYHGDYAYNISEQTVQGLDK